MPPASALEGAAMARVVVVPACGRFPSVRGKGCVVSACYGVIAAAMSWPRALGSPQRHLAAG